MILDSLDSFKVIKKKNNFLYIVDIIMTRCEP